MYIYEYDNIVSYPNLEQHDSLGEICGGIDYDVKNSTMSNKNILGSTWHEDLQMLYIQFETELSSEDKSKLDTIVDNNS